MNKKKKKPLHSSKRIGECVRVHERVSDRDRVEEKKVDICMYIACFFSCLLQTFPNEGTYYNHIQLRESERSNNTYI